MSWALSATWALGIVVVLEALYLLLRRALPRFRLRLFYHLWALSLGGLVAVTAQPGAPRAAWQLAQGSALVLTAIFLFALVEAAVLLRPWNLARGPMMPELARDVLLIGLVAVVATAAAKWIFDQRPTAILAFSTASLAVVGLALQDVMKNLFAGMALQFEKPFQTGDWLLVNETPAQVIDITWRSTRLRTNDGHFYSEPNNVLIASRVVNLGSGREPVAFQLAVHLPYEAPPAQVKAAILEAVRTAPGALASPAPEVFLDRFGDHGVHYKVRVWTRQITSIIRFRSDVNSRIWYQLHRRGLAVPMPIRTVRLHDQERVVERQRGEEGPRAAATLARLPLFRALAPAALERLGAAARRLHFDDGEALVREGEEGDSLFVIERGRVVISKSGQGLGGERVELARLAAGDFFGEMSLLTGEPRSATVNAEGPSEVLVLAREALAPLLQEDPTVAESLSHALAERTAEASAKLEARRERERAAPSQVQASLLGRIRSFFGLPDDQR